MGGKIFSEYLKKFYFYSKGWLQSVGWVVTPILMGTRELEKYETFVKILTFNHKEFS